MINSTFLAFLAVCFFIFCASSYKIGISTTNLNYTGTNPIANGYIRGIQSGANTLIQVDADGVGSTASFSTLVTLNNFTATNFSQNNLIF